MRSNAQPSNSSRKPLTKSQRRQISRRKFLKGAFGLTLIGGVGVFSESKTAYQVGVTKRDLVLPRFDADGIRIAHLADFHANNKAKADRAILAIDLADAEKPDLIVMTGDFIDSDKDSVLDQLKRVMNRLGECSCPIAMVMGNHDYWVNQPRKVIEILESTKARLLRNEILETNGVKIAGIDDGIAGRSDYHCIGLSGDKNVIALLHEPDFVVNMDDRVSLMLAGHSHGGQVCLPGGWAMHTPFGARKYIKGFYDKAKVPLFVSRGIGTIGIDERAFCPPEVVILTLKSS